MTISEIRGVAGIVPGLHLLTLYRIKQHIHWAAPIVNKLCTIRGFVLVLY